MTDTPHPPSTSRRPMTPDFATPDDDLIELIEALAVIAAGLVIGTVLGAGLVVRAVRRRWVG